MGTLAQGQLYFPPTTGSVWDTSSAAALGWCTTERDTLLDYVESRNSKSFLILHKGKIVEEHYMNGFGQDSIWYWASAGKSLMGFLIGMAQEDGLLDINDKTSQYLNTGWTSAPGPKEDLIRIKHQISMTTGLDYMVPNLDCLEDTCLEYLHDAGTHWYYHNAPYRLTQDVLEAASGKNLNTFTFQSLFNATGMVGLWIDYIFVSRARDMARFGLLCLNKGTWNNQAVLGDTAYFDAMVNSSQTLNQAYGYLWWLNGKSTYKLPGSDLVFTGSIVPNAPMDMYMAAGKNDQRIYIVPSMDLVVVRQGDAAYSSALALSVFDDELWGLIMNYICQPFDQTEVSSGLRLSLSPNPTNGLVKLHGNWGSKVLCISSSGVCHEVHNEMNLLNIATLPTGMYLIVDAESGFSTRLVKR